MVITLMVMLMVMNNGDDDTIFVTRRTLKLSCNRL